MEEQGGYGTCAWVALVWVAFEGECVGGLVQGLGGWGRSYVGVCCESGLFV